jgi:hypothetical protein
MDNDGKPDIISCSDYDVVSVYRNDPMPIISPAHPSVCHHNNIDLTVTPEATYQWQVDTGTGFYNLSNIAPYNGVYTDTLHITDADTSMNGYIYRCMVMNSNITKYSRNDTLAVHPLPVPVITGTPPFYNTGSFASYQWLMNGNVITGATSQHYTATQSGTYSVLVTDVYGCSDTSATVTLMNAGLAGLNGNGIINIYPNPASEQLVVDAPIPVQASITDELGRQIMQVNNAHYLNIHQLQSGIYFIVVTDKDDTILKREKIVKE